jgi:hypothetical protein
MLDADPERRRVPARLQNGIGGDRFEAAGITLPIGALAGLAEVQESGCAGGEACSIKGKFAVRAKLTGHRGIYHLESCGSQGGRPRVASGRTASQADASAGLIFSFDV